MKKFPITPLGSKILFEFEEKIVSNNTGQKMFESVGDDSPIVVLGSQNDSIKTPRWGKVLAVGPKVQGGITAGMRVCIDSLKWTNELRVDGLRFWQSEEKHVLLVED